ASIEAGDGASDTGASSMRGAGCGANPSSHSDGTGVVGCFTTFTFGLSGAAALRSDNADSDSSSRPARPSRSILITLHYIVCCDFPCGGCSGRSAREVVARTVIAHPVGHAARLPPRALAKQIDDPSDVERHVHDGLDAIGDVGRQATNSVGM